MTLHLPVVQPEGELAHIAVKVLEAGVVIDTMDAALHDRPDALNPVRVNIIADILARAVVDALVGVEQAVQSDIGPMLVRVQRRADFNMIVDGALQGVRRGVGDHASLGAIAALTHTQHRRLADRAAPGFQLLALVLVGFLAADIHLVNLNDAAQHARIVAARLAEPLDHEPRGFLGHADLLRQLKAADPLAGRDEHIHGVNPLVQGDVRPLKDRARADGEVRLAGVAAIEAALAGRDALRLVAAGANRPIRPTLAFHVDPRGLRVGEHLEQFKGGDGGLAHWATSSPSRSSKRIATNKSSTVVEML